MSPTVTANGKSLCVLSGGLPGAAEFSLATGDVAAGESGVSEMLFKRSGILFYRLTRPFLWPEHLEEARTPARCSSPRAPHPWWRRLFCVPWTNPLPEYPRRAVDSPRIYCGALASG